MRQVSIIEIDRKLFLTAKTTTRVTIKYRKKQIVRRSVIASLTIIFLLAQSIVGAVPTLNLSFYLANLEKTDVSTQQPDPSSLYARSAALIDGNTGRLLYGKEADECLPMASTTKIMTCILVLETMKPDQICTVSSYAASQPQVRLGVKSGWEFRCEDLLYSLMLESHNDTAVVLAEAAAGSVEKFAQLMNQKAKEIGLNQTHFVTPNGLDDEGHYTTARELALLLRYCIRTSPKSKEFLKITQTANYAFTDCTGLRSFSVYNHNAFLQMMDGALTGKTGFTGKAGYCYVGALEKDGRLYIVSLLACGWPGNKSYKWSDTKKLMKYGLATFENKKLEMPPIPKMKAEVIEGVYDWSKEAISEVELICKEPPKSYQILAKAGEKIEIRIQARQELAAPVSPNEACGEVSYWFGEVCLGNFPIYPARSVDRQSFFWYIRRVLSILL